jgi:hypothetical protein
MSTQRSDLSATEYKVIRSLMGRFHSSWGRELMTAECMYDLQAKGMVVRDQGHWKLTTLGLLFASAPR